MNSFAFTSSLGKLSVLRGSTSDSPQLCLRKSIYGARVNASFRVPSPTAFPRIQVKATATSPSPAAIDTYQCPIKVPKDGNQKASVSSAPIISEATSVHLVPSRVHKNFHMNAEGANDGTVQFDGFTYELEEFHVHSPSENYLVDSDSASESEKDSSGNSGSDSDGLPEGQFPLEMHLVHTRKTADGETKAAVLALFAETDDDEDAYNEEFQKMLDHAESLTPVTINVKNMIKKGLKQEELLTFWGSKTTDPFTTGIQWIVSKEPIKIKSSQLEQYKTTTGVEVPNNRELMKVLERTITSYSS